MTCANTHYTNNYHAREDARAAIIEKATARLLLEVDYDLCTFSQAADGMMPDGFYSAREIADSRMTWATQEKRNNTIGAVHALQAIHRAYRIGASLSANELAIGALLVKLVDKWIANTATEESY